MDRSNCKKKTAFKQIQANFLCSEATIANWGITGLKRHIYVKTADHIFSIIKKGNWPVAKSNKHFLTKKTDKGLVNLLPTKYQIIYQCKVLEMTL